MKATKGRRFLCALLSMVMLFSLLPISVLADDATVTATQITQASELVDGQYVLVTDSGYAPGVLDGTWLTAAAVTADENAVTVDPALLWTVTVGTDGIKLKDSSGNPDYSGDSSLGRLPSSRNENSFLHAFSNNS